MKTSPTNFSYEHSATIPLDCARRLVKAWANRRGYPITIEEIADHKVHVIIYAPSTREHNRAVRSLTRILDRLILHSTPLS